jgi:sarcosine oxidase subunit beta
MVSQRIAVPASTAPTVADVVIVGAGIVGASIAWHLARSGCRDVLLLEREAHQGRGSTGKSMGGVRAQFSTDVNIRLSLYSIPFYARFEDETGHPCGYRPHGYLFVATSARHLDYLQANHVRQRALGLREVTLLAPRDVCGILPQIHADDIVGGSYCPTDGFVDPYSVMTGFTQSAVDFGVRLRKRTTVQAIEVSGGRVIGVRTREGRIASRNVVLAAGAWAAPLAKTAGVDLPVAPHRRMLVPTEPFAGLPGRLPMVIDMGTGFHFRPEGRGYLLAWEDSTEPPCNEPVFDRRFVERVLAKAAERVPVFADLAVNPAKGWAGLYEMSPDKHGILGPVSGVDGLWLANGFSGHGVMHAPATGRILADLIVSGRCEAVPWSELSFQRFASGRLLHEHAIL